MDIMLSRTSIVNITKPHFKQIQYNLCYSYLQFNSVQFILFLHHKNTIQNISSMVKQKYLEKENLYLRIYETLPENLRNSIFNSTSISTLIEKSQLLIRKYHYFNATYTNRG